jgi:hypothetical protein
LTPFTFAIGISYPWLSYWRVQLLPVLS